MSLDIGKLAEDLKITDMPGDLRVILEKYVALYTLAANCLSKDVTAGMGLVQIESECELNFDARGFELWGKVNLEDLIREWSALSLGDAAIILKARYENSTDDNLASKLEDLLKPLEDVGWCISVSKSEEEYSIHCLISADAMMTGVRQLGDEDFFQRFFGFNPKPSEPDYERIIAVAEKALSRELSALEAMKRYGVTREGLGLSKEPAVCRILRDIINAAKNSEPTVKALIKDVDIATVRKEFRRC